MKIRTNLLALFAASCLAAEAETTVPPGIASCFDDAVRISALIQFPDGIRVGVVDAASGESRILGIGEPFAGIEVIDADYDTEIVTLRRGEEQCVLSLADDPDAIRLPSDFTTHPELYRGEAIERFLREFPNAEADGMIKFPIRPPLEPVTGKGPGIEAFLQQNPEWAEMADMVVTGLGPGIERLIAENPDLVPPAEIPEGGLGPGIEAAMQNQPLLETNLFEQMLQEQGLSLPEAP